jgi:hypothetical protein
MNDFFSKLENFFFDILGLILPGAIFLLILLSPVLLVDMAKMEKAADTSVMISALVTIWNILKAYWASNPKSALTIVTILAYLIGHTVKVFSRIKYDFLAAIFDEGVNKLIIRAYKWTKKRLLPRPPEFLKSLFKPIKNLITSIFTFKTADYSSDNATIREKSIKELNTRLDMEFPDTNYSIVKFSSVITNYEGLRSLGTFYLAKYNLYRSLALIFLFTTIYYWYFFGKAKDFLSATSHEISTLILVSPIILWFTFHEKYKRYWNLYGGERLMTLFYFLNKKKINERG